MLGDVHSYLSVWQETLRLALCGPDYNRISAVTYYTTLSTISETVGQPWLWGLRLYLITLVLRVKVH